MLDKSYLLKNQTIITKQGHDLLEKVVTNTIGQVYCFKPGFPNTIIAAAMARLSRRAGDLRLCLLDEFVTELEKFANLDNHTSRDDSSYQLISRVVTEYGDDSVAQLATLNVVVESCSNLMTKKLEWGRLGSYLEQSSRYIYYDLPQEDGNYNFYLPPELDPDTSKQYQNTINKIFDLYSIVVRELTNHVRKNSEKPSDKLAMQAWNSATRAQACDAARSMLPVATNSTVGMVMSAQALEALILRLFAEDNSESKSMANSLLVEARKVAPAFFERTDREDRGQATSMYIHDKDQASKNLAEQLIGYDDSEEVVLLNYYPKDLNLLLAACLFENTATDYRNIVKQINSWSEGKKQEIIKAYVGKRYNRRHKPGRAFEMLHLHWQITSDYGSFRDLQRHRMLDNFTWQRLSPRLGFEIPELVKQAGLAEIFEEAFDLSFSLYHLLFSQGYSEIAQYATLFGHRMRYSFIENLREAFHLHELRTSPQGHPSYRRIVGKMQEELAKVLPELASEMIFVNTAEDPQLTRMAAELVKQQKLLNLAKQESKGDLSNGL